MNKKQMQESGATPYEILMAEVSALWDIVEVLPVDPHDMDVHFWCRHEDEDEE